MDGSSDVCNDLGSFISAAKFPSSLGQVPLFKDVRANCFCASLRPVYIGDFCGDLSGDFCGDSKSPV